MHERLVSLGRDRAAHEREVCRWLLAAERLGVHTRGGYASIREYADRVIGLSARQTEERLRVGRALAKLPLLDRALASGELRWSAVRELTRIATAQTEGAWVDWARRRRAKEIEVAVAMRQPGDGPRDRGNPALVTHRLVFEVRAETMALFRDLQAAVGADLGGQVDDDALLLEVARRALGGPADEGRASYQVAVTVCSECGRASVDAGGEPHYVDEVVAEMARCDAQQVGETRPNVGRHPQVGQATGSRATTVDATVAVTHVGATGSPRRATQSIPPATRRLVMRRDRKRCAVPGCNNHRFLDVHHLDLRSEGGGHDPERLAVLCGAHHRAVHSGALRIDGTAAAGFVFRHADGSAYGATLRLRAAGVVQQTLSALQRMGFKSKHARVLVDEALRVATPSDPAVLLRAALRTS